MAKSQKKKKGRDIKSAVFRPKDFLDMIAPAAVRFNTDHYILGGSYHCALALRGYPTSTEELALLRHLGEKSGVTLRVYTRQVNAAEEKAILHNATNKSRMERSNSNDMKQSITAEANLQDGQAGLSPALLQMPGLSKKPASMRKRRGPIRKLRTSPRSAPSMWAGISPPRLGRGTPVSLI